MLIKAKLIKKEESEKNQSPKKRRAAMIEKRDRLLFTQHIVQTAKDWAVNHQQKKSNARQSFASLFET